MPDASVARFTYRAFISYSHRDKAWADWLHKALETYRVPSRLVGTTTAHGVIPRRLNPVFRDRDELSSSPELGTKINEALARSENLIVICSPASAASHWVNQEVLAYKRIGRAARVFCLIVDGEPNATDLPGREAEECFCPALRFATDADGRPTSERAEPIAADARAGRDGKSNAKLKLIAGMLGVGFDALKQREQRRQVQRMTAIAGIALAVTAVTIVLAIAALVSRHRAVVAQHEAVVARQAAVRRQKQAEALVNFMLGDLNDKLNQLSRLDIMQAVDDRAMAYFTSLPSTDVNGTALAQRARALEKIGTIRMDAGNLPGALQAYRASAGISSRLAAAQPHDVAAQVAYSRTLAYIGMACWNQGKLAEARHDFETARRVLQHSLEHSPGDLPLLRQMTSLDDNLDHVLATQGQPDKALGMAKEWLELDERLIQSKPADTDYVQDSGAAHNELGRLALQRGDLTGAITEYRADDAIETQLAMQQPNNNDQRNNMLMTRAILGRTLALAGDGVSGIHDLEQSVQIAGQLSRSDPKDKDSRDELGLYSTQLARLQRAGGDLTAANASNKQALEILANLTQTDPTNQGWQDDYAVALSEQAAEALATADAATARGSAQNALRILEPMLAKQPNDRGTLLDTLEAKLLLASSTGDSKAVQALCEQAMATIGAVKTDPLDPRLLALRVRTLLMLDRKADAQPLIGALLREGYRDPELLASLRKEHIAYSPHPAVVRSTARAESK